jgi:hypothetical protein
VGAFDSSALTNYPALNGDNLLIGTNAVSGVLLATNVNNVFNGTLIGNLQGTASTATSAVSFSGLLGGDVIGTQNATVVATVGGQTAAHVALGAGAANAATDANTAGTIVKRDTFGNFSAGTITANLVGSASTATNLVGEVADSQLSSNIPRLNAANLFASTTILAGPLYATNPNNIVTGTISGNGSGLTNLPTTQTYLYCYDTNTQTLVAVGAFQDITFANNAQISGWSHTAGSAGFTNGPAGIYLVEYTAESAVANNNNSTFSVHALLNGTEIAGSQSVAGPSTSALPVPLSKSFIVNIATANTNVIKLQFTGSNSNNRLLANSGVGTTRPSASLTIIRIQ